MGRDLPDVWSCCASKHCIGEVACNFNSLGPIFDTCMWPAWGPLPGEIFMCAPGLGRLFNDKVTGSVKITIIHFIHIMYLHNNATGRERTQQSVFILYNRVKYPLFCSCSWCYWCGHTFTLCCTGDFSSDLHENLLSITCNFRNPRFKLFGYHLTKVGISHL